MNKTIHSNHLNWNLTIYSGVSFLRGRPFGRGGPWWACIIPLETDPFTIPVDTEPFTPLSLHWLWSILDSFPILGLLIPRLFVTFGFVTIPFLFRLISDERSALCPMISLDGWSFTGLCFKRNFSRSLLIFLKCSIPRRV